jgi:hypothetical protein
MLDQVHHLLSQYVAIQQRFDYQILLINGQSRRLLVPSIFFPKQARRAFYSIKTIN